MFPIWKTSYGFWILRILKHMSDYFHAIRLLFFLGILIGICPVLTVGAENETDEVTAYIDLSLPSSIEVGDTIFVEGYIMPSLLTRPGDKILLQVTSPKESRADKYYQLKAGEDGIFSLELPADAIGDWNFQARYADYSTDLIPVKVTSRIKTKESILTINGPFSILHIGDTATMSGWLRDIDDNGIPYRPVWYSFGLPFYSCAVCDDDERRIWQTLGPVTTDETGYFEFNFNIRDQGTYAVKASFPGDEIYALTNSDTVYPQVL